MNTAKKRIITLFTLLIVTLGIFVFSGCQIIEEYLLPNSAVSAYEIAVKNGFTGSESEWLASLKGEKGDKGEATVIESLYEEAKENGFSGTFFEFLNQYIQTENTQTTEFATNIGLMSAVSVYSKFTITKSIYSPWNSSSNTEEVVSAGAGVIYQLDKEKGDAYIITNYHVVYNVSADDKISQDITIYLYGKEINGQEITASYFGGSMTYDIAVLKISNSQILKDSQAVAVTVADSNDIVVGMNAIAIGNPEAGGISATSGIVSVDSEYITMTASDEQTTIQYRVIRVDTAVNSGNSGGGLYNNKGQLIGIVNAKIIEEDVENIAYAIPSNIAIAVADNLLRNVTNQNKNPIKCLFGVTLQITNSYAEYDASTLTAKVVHTVSVQNVSSDGVAFGKLQAGDIIKSITVNNKTTNIERMHTIIDLMLYCDKNDSVTLSVNRGGTLINIDITLTNAEKVI